MGENHFFLGSYQSVKDNLTFNRVKYQTICCLLDYFALKNSIFHVREIFSRDALVNMVMKNTRLRNTKENREFIETAINQMTMMGLLVQEGYDYTITQKGFKAFVDHTFHKIVYDINAQRESRRHSIIAIIIATLSILTTLAVSLF